MPLDADVLGLLDRVDVVALDAAALLEDAELAPEARSLVAAAREAGLEVRVAGKGGRVAEHLKVEHLPAGTHLQGAIRDLQAAGHVVALVSASNQTALAAADCGIGIVAGAGAVPWTADLLCGPGLAEVRLLLNAVGTAREVSRRSLLFALGGSSLGALLALASRGPLAPRRALGAVNASAVAVYANATWEGLQLSWQPRPVRRDRTPWHALPTDEAPRALETSAAGLDAASVLERDTDELRPDRSPPGLGRALASEFANPLTPALALGAVMSSMLSSTVDAALVAGVLDANALVGGLQRLQTDRAVRDLAETTAVPVRVRREDKELEVPADELVPGDVVLLRAGDPVPADCRILEATGLEADESSLTGEGGSREGVEARMASLVSSTLPSALIGGAARRLSQRNALVRNPRTIEALGRVDVLCFDKTGTPTKGKIRLQQVTVGGSDEELDTLSDAGRHVLAAALRASPDPSNGELNHATDRAVISGGAAAGANPDEGCAGWQRSTRA